MTIVPEWRNTLVRAGISIRDALAVIESGGFQIALVVDESDRLRGTLTDGDVRRGMLRGIKLEDSVEQVMNSKPHTVATETPRSAIRALMGQLRIHHFPVVNPEGRVVDLIQIDDVIEPPANDAWVVLMAGGLGTRLKPLTETTPKPMIPVGGRPLIENIILGFVAQGFRRFFLAVNYKAELFQDYFGDGRRLGVKIEYLHERERKGTAGALSLLPERPSAPFLVMNGDLLTTVNFRHLLDFHREHRAWATMCVREHVFQVPYGVVEADDFRLRQLTEKPLRTCLVNAGIYALNPDLLDVIPPDRMYDMTDLFADVIAAKHEAVVFPLREYWMDIGRMEDLERAAMEYPRVFE